MFTYNHNFYTKITYIIRISVHQKKKGKSFPLWKLVQNGKRLQKFYISRFQKWKSRKHQELWTCLRLTGINISWEEKKTNWNKRWVERMNIFEYFFSWNSIFVRVKMWVYLEGIINEVFENWSNEKALFTWVLTFYFILSVDHFHFKLNYTRVLFSERAIPWIVKR